MNTAASIIALDGRRGHVRAAGFTLIEILITTLIVSLILGALLVPLSAQFQARRFQEAQGDLVTIRAALIGFALANGRLPCPDTNSEAIVTRPDGLEDAAVPVTNGCAAVDGANPDLAFRGWLPWATLGVPATDPWGNYYRYQVMTGLTVPAQPTLGCPPGNARISLCSTSNLQVLIRGDNPATAAIETTTSVVVANQVAAVIFSTGANGRGGLSPTRPAPVPFTAANGTAQDEYRNVTDVAVPATPAFTAQRMRLVSGPPRGLDPAAVCADAPLPAGAVPCAFDDVMVWIPLGELKTRMVETSWLP